MAAFVHMLQRMVANLGAPVAVGTARSIIPVSAETMSEAPRPCPNP
jgi:hypothetical protein